MATHEEHATCKGMEEMECELFISSLLDGGYEVDEIEREVVRWKSREDRRREEMEDGLRTKNVFKATKVVEPKVPTLFSLALASLPLDTRLCVGDRIMYAYNHTTNEVTKSYEVQLLHNLILPILHLVDEEGVGRWCKDDVVTYHESGVVVEDRCVGLVGFEWEVCEEEEWVPRKFERGVEGEEEDWEESEEWQVWEEEESEE
jgi:hypothetical protein